MATKTDYLVNQLFHLADAMDKDGQLELYTVTYQEIRLAAERLGVLNLLHKPELSISK